MNAAGDVTTGTLTTPAPGINARSAICGGQFCGGAEEESCEEFRKRYLERLAYQPRATMAWIKQKFLEFPCATRVCVREGSCCRCDPECIGLRLQELRQQHELLRAVRRHVSVRHSAATLVNDITDGCSASIRATAKGRSRSASAARSYAPIPLPVNVFIDIAGCPSTAQKQMIEDHIHALFQRICPSMPLCTKQIELIIAIVIGAEINASVRFEVVGYEEQVPPYPRELVYIDDAAALEPECDVLPCLNEVIFTVLTCGSRHADDAAHLRWRRSRSRIECRRLRAVRDDADDRLLSAAAVRQRSVLHFRGVLQSAAVRPAVGLLEGARRSATSRATRIRRECPLLQDPACPSLVLHSIYTVLKLRHVVHGALWLALRESNPYTAVTTLDYIWRGCTGRTATASIAARCCSAS